MRQIEVFVRDANGDPRSVSVQLWEMATQSVNAFYCQPGGSITVEVQDHSGLALERWKAVNVFPAKVVTMTRFEDGMTACTDDAGNTYTSFPTDLFIDFKGWRFRAPFHCMYCAVEVSPQQWAFSRSCGGCDVSNSHTARLSIFDGRIFSGPRELIDPKDSHFLVEERFLDPKDAEKFPVRNPMKPVMVFPPLLGLKE
jgi:hypothetical protein